MTDAHSLCQIYQTKTLLETIYQIESLFKVFARGSVFFVDATSRIEEIVVPPSMARSLLMWLHGECVASTTGEKRGDVGVLPAPLARSLPHMQKPPTAMARHVPTWNMSRHCILRDPLTSNAAIASCEIAASGLGHCSWAICRLGLNHLKASCSYVRVTCFVAVQGSHGYSVPIKWPEDFGENWLHRHALIMACVVFI